MSDELGTPSRDTGSILGALEHRLLVQLAKVMPSGITSDMLTILGLVGAAVTGAAYCLCYKSVQFLWLANLGLMLNWLGDSLDGTLARVRRKERLRYGFLVDHSADLLAQLLIGLGFGVSPFVRFDIACIGLIVYLAFAVFSFIKTTVSGKLQIAFNGVGPTEVRCALIVVNVSFLWYRPRAVVALWEPLSPVDLLILAFAAVETIVLIFTIMGEIRRTAIENR